MMQTQTIEYLAQGELMEGFYAYDEKVGSPTGKPLVLVSHDWSGCNDFVKEKAKKLAELGYVGFALDMYGKGRLGRTTDEKMALLAPLKANRDLLRQRIQTALAVAKNLPMVDKHKAGALGFCFGGLCVLDLARSGAELKGVVSFHGLLDAPQGVEKGSIKAKILVLHGYDDPMVPPAQLELFAQEMTQGQVDWQIHVYGNTKHSFTNPQAHDVALGLIYEPKAAQRSWQAMKNFFEEIF